MDGIIIVTRQQRSHDVAVLDTADNIIRLAKLAGSHVLAHTLGGQSWLMWTL